MSMLRTNQVLQHGIERDTRFRVLASLGRGGFGEAYEVVHVDEEDNEFDNVCLKITDDDLTWHGETYFMRLLQGDSHAVQIEDAFPVQVGEGAAARTRFCITMELLRGRSVADLCETGELPWSEERVARQLRYVLRTLSTLHQLQTPHRDITPGNTYIGARSSLKLGDFGITTTAKLKRGVPTFGIYAPAFRPPDLKTFWDRRDDVYQIGLLALTLLSGEVQYSGVKRTAVNPLTARDSVLREVLKKALDVKSRRYDHAMAMEDALK
jgi:serine/threonine protein kinase